MKRKERGRKEHRGLNMWVGEGKRQIPKGFESQTKKFRYITSLEELLQEPGPCFPYLSSPFLTVATIELPHSKGLISANLSKKGFDRA